MLIFLLSLAVLPPTICACIVKTIPRLEHALIYANIRYRRRTSIYVQANACLRRMEWRDAVQRTGKAAHEVARKSARGRLCTGLTRRRCFERFDPGRKIVLARLSPPLPVHVRLVAASDSAPALRSSRRRERRSACQHSTLCPTSGPCVAAAILIPAGIIA